MLQTYDPDGVEIFVCSLATNIAPLQGAKNPVRGLMFVENSFIKDDPVRCKKPRQRFYVCRNEDKKGNYAGA